MCLKTLVLAVIITTCLANLDDERQIVLHRLRRSLIEVPDAILDDYASSSLPYNVEGFYSHPSDCTKFYRCIYVSGNNDYMPVTFTCPKGTRFSNEHNTCISGTCVRGLTPVAAVASSNDENLQCSSEGRFPHPDDCGQFYDCIPSHNGGFVAHQQSCNGLGYDPTLKACVKPQMIEGCTPVSTRSFTAIDSKLKQICKDEGHKFTCSDCRTLVLCANGIPYTKPCEDGSVCSIKKIFGGGVCFPSDKVEHCKCKAADTFQRDVYNPSKYLSCGPEGSVAIISSCEDGSVFNEELKRCTQRCTKPGPLPIKEDCTSYMLCISTIGGWIPEIYKCDDFTVFNERTGQCENPCDWYGSSFTCETEGRFPNQVECTKFHECIADPFNPNSIHSVEYECPEGHVWSQTVNNNVGSCVATSNAKCTSCKFPKEWCENCPEGFIRSADRKCFKLFTDQSRSWDEAKKKCEDENLRLAEPGESITVALRKTLVDKYGDTGFTWVGGRGDGSSFKWASGDGGVPNDSNLWGRLPRGTDNSRCLLLLADNSRMSQQPTHPYVDHDCSNAYPALCERVTG